MTEQKKCKNCRHEKVYHAGKWANHCCFYKINNKSCPCERWEDEN